MDGLCKSTQESDMTNTIKPFDVYGNTQNLDDAVLDAVATRLESRGKHPIFQQMLYEYLEFIKIDELHAVLDLGCGTGFTGREIARRHYFKGTVLGIDISSQLVEHATRLASEEGVNNRIHFRVGDSRSLDLENDSFDAVIAHTLISHLTDPETLIEEMIRLVKPGGLVVIFDGDYASLTFSNPDAQRGKAMDDLVIGSIVTQPRILRQLPLLLTTAGLQIVQAFAYVVADIGKADFWAASVESMRKLLPAAKTMTAAEAAAWAEERNRESAKETFFASCNYYSYIARKAIAS
jgi:ubiquinone/menaquinone biosynthesis C-methylase UbiE